MKTKTLAILLMMISFGLMAQEKFYGNWIITRYIDSVKNEDYMKIDSMIPIELQAFQDSVLESIQPLTTFMSINKGGDILIYGSDLVKGKWTKINSDTISLFENDRNTKAIMDTNGIIIFDNLTKGKYKGIKLPKNYLKSDPNLIGKKLMFDALTNDKYTLKFKNDSVVYYKNRYNNGTGKWKLHKFEDLNILYLNLDDYHEFVFYLYSDRQNGYNALMFHSDLNISFGDKIDTILLIK